MISRKLCLQPHQLTGNAAFILTVTEKKLSAVFTMEKQSHANNTDSLRSTDGFMQHTSAADYEI